MLSLESSASCSCVRVQRSGSFVAAKSAIARTEAEAVLKTCCTNMEQVKYLLFNPVRCYDVRTRRALEGGVLKRMRKPSAAALFELTG
jgi:hypothetical protein